jgi:F0F1-type ATP synthase assembly protein I
MIKKLNFNNDILCYNSLDFESEFVMIDAFSMASTVVVALFLGINIDRFYKTSPLFTIGITFLGLGLYIYSMLKRTK